MASLIQLSKQAAALSADAITPNIKSLPGLKAGPDNALETLRETVPHGTKGRILRPQAGGVKIKQMQGPRSYAPRLNMPTI